MPKNSRPAQGAKVDDLVAIRFLDHAQNSDDVMEFMVYGRVAKVTQRAYHVVSWEYVDPVDRAADRNPENENWFCIVKKAIIGQPRILK